MAHRERQSVVHGAGGETSAQQIGVFLSGSSKRWVFLGATVTHGLTIASAICGLIFIRNLDVGDEGTNDFIRTYSTLEWIAFVILSVSTSGWRLLPFGGRTVKTLHGFFNTIALACLLSACGIAWRFQSMNEIDRFESVHSHIATVTILIALLQFLLGFGLFVWPRLETDTPSRLPGWHRFLGQLTYMALFATMIAGLANVQRLTKMADGAWPSALSLLLFFNFAAVYYWWSPASLVKKGSRPPIGRGDYEAIPEQPVA